MKRRNYLIASLCFCLVAILGLSVCTDPENKKNDPTPVDPASLGFSALCPGAVGCMKAEGELMAGAAAVAFTPTHYEVARVSYIGEKGYCPEPMPEAPFGVKRCGRLTDRAGESRKDCGRDGLCPNDKIKTRVACDENTPCPQGLTCEVGEKACYLRYTAPDEDGSEGDGLEDWFLDCGRDRICPCLDPKGEPAYYGAGKQCLKGDKPNPAYKGPDEDGTEGDGKFDAYWMAGFSGNVPMMGSHDDIWARALVLQTGDTTVAIVSLDLVGFFHNKIEEIRARVKERLPNNEVDYILISSTHAHEGPDSVGQWGRAQGGIPIETGARPDFLKDIVEKTAQAIVEAQGKLRKAKLRVGLSRTGREGFLRDSRDPKIFYDEVHVMQLTAVDGGEVISTLVNWGNHPEALSDINNFVSSDFPHFTREALEKGLPKGASTPEIPAYGGVAIYLQGAVGALMTPLGVDVPDLDGTLQKQSNYAKTRALGQQLAVKAFEALEKSEEIAKADVAVWAKQIRVEVENRLFQIIFQLGNIFDRQVVDFNQSAPISPENMPKIITEVGVIRLGEAITFYSMPGELDPEILIGGYDGSRSFGIEIIDPKNPNPPDLSKAPKGPYLKERMPGKYKFFVGLGNDFLGYILPSWNYQLDAEQPYFRQAPGHHYEETNGLGPSIGPTLLKLYDELIPKLQKPGPPAP
jgi:hypothetical protein